MTCHSAGHEKCRLESSQSRHVFALSIQNNLISFFSFVFIILDRAAMLHRIWNVIVSEEMQSIRQQHSLIWANICSANVVCQFMTSQLQLQSK